MYVTEVDSIWAPKPLPFQPIPSEYQGWVFLAFVVLGFVAVLYGFWLITTDPTLGKPEPVRRRK